MFSGINKLPICGLAIPRARLEARLRAFEFRHDLSEDYALFLLVLTDPDLPGVHECPKPIAHISIRDSENSVLMHDRRPWECATSCDSFRCHAIPERCSVQDNGHCTLPRRTTRGGP